MGCTSSNDNEVKTTPCAAQQRRVRTSPLPSRRLSPLSPKKQSDLRGGENAATLAAALSGPLFDAVNAKLVGFECSVGELSPCLLYECVAMQRFRLGLEKCGFCTNLSAFLAHPSNFEICTHGTKTFQGIEQICCKGWDTSRRKGQAHGRGEYFDRDIATARSYGAPTGAVIVALAIAPDKSDGKVKIENGGRFLVIDNDSDNLASYCLPVAVVRTPSDRPLLDLDCPAMRVARPATHVAEYRDAQTGRWTEFSAVDVVAMCNSAADNNALLFLEDVTANLADCTRTLGGQVTPIRFARRILRRFRKEAKEAKPRANEEANDDDEDDEARDSPLSSADAYLGGIRYVQAIVLAQQHIRRAHPSPFPSSASTTAACGSIPPFLASPSALTSVPSVVNFDRAVRECGFADLKDFFSDAANFAVFGSPSMAVPSTMLSICRNGWTDAAIDRLSNGNGGRFSVAYVTVAPAKSNGMVSLGCRGPSSSSSSSPDASASDDRGFSDEAPGLVDFGYALPLMTSVVPCFVD